MQVTFSKGQSGLLWRVSTQQSEGNKVAEHWASMAFFWSGDDLKDFLFKGFTVNAQEGLAGVCIGLASSAILYEGLRNLRDYYYYKFLDKRTSTRAQNARKRSNSLTRKKVTASAQQNPGAHPPDFDPGAGGDMGDASTSLMRSPVEDEDDYELNTRSGNSFSVPKKLGKACSKDSVREFLLLGVSTLLHLVYIWIGYILMLAVMTFNVWVLVAILIGVGIGQFIFGSLRRAVFLNGEKTFINWNQDTDISPSATATTELGVPDAERRPSSLRQEPSNNERIGSSGATSSSAINTRSHLTTAVDVHRSTSTPPSGGNST